MVKLYIWDSCPFCLKVIGVVDNLAMVEGRDYIIVDSAPGTSGRMEVQQQGGKSMVPFLVDEKVTMYESNDIILYLKKKFS